MIAYKFKLYRTKKTSALDNVLEEARLVWNHCLAMQKRYYRMYGQFIPKFTLSKHMTKAWHRQYLGSQSLQEIVERLDASYRRFFNHTAKRPPKFKKRGEMQSFVFKQAGYRFNGNTVLVTIGKRRVLYKFSRSRQYEGNIKTVGFHRSPLGEYYVVITTDGTPKHYGKSHKGASVGVDFGLKSYLTLSDGRKIGNPQYMKASLSEMRKASRRLSRSKTGSHNRERARLALCRAQEKVVNRRRDFQWKLAHDMCRQYDAIFVESLNLNCMCRRWGRKMADLSHGTFVEILKYVAGKYGVTVHEIDRWYPSSQMCECGYRNSSLTLATRRWQCPCCGAEHDRDVNAARNILRKGISELVSDGKTNEAVLVEEQSRYQLRIPRL